ncbi:MAG: TolC family protein [Planctomycetes bacterium]|nr:TolC family protein [Planctomycetota bacterium]
MNKNIKTKISFALLAILLSLAGCDEFAKEETFRTIRVSPQRTQQIETLELEKFKAEPQTEIKITEKKQPAETLELTLEQCRAYTLQNNLDLKVALVNPTIAAEGVKQEEAKFEALFFAEGRLQKIDQPQASSDDLIASTADNSQTDFGVRMPLRTGGNVTFNLADSRSKSNFASSTFNPSYNTNLQFSISQPLLRNAGKRVNTYTIRAAQYNAQQVNAQTKLNVIIALSTADELYWRLYASRKELEVRKQQHDLAMALLEQARRFVAAGQNPKIDEIRAEAGVARQLAAIIQSENTVRDRERQLKLVLNKPDLAIDTPTILITATEPDPVYYRLDRKLFTITAIANRMELLQAELEIAKAISDIDLRRNQMLPLLTASYTYTISGLGSSLDDSHKLIDDRDFENHYMGLRLEVPLGNEAAKSKLRNAIYNRMQQLATKEKQQLLVTKEVLAAIDLVETNWQQLLSGRQSSLLEGQLYSAELRQFQLGLNTSTDVLQAQTNLADAQSAEILALANYQISLIELAKATGTLLGAAKVQWESTVIKNHDM